jgi:hypothetical protein
MVVTSSQELLRQILQAVQESAVSDRAGKDTRSQFWATYNREAGEYDAEFLEKYKSDMDIVLIFVSSTMSLQSSFNQCHLQRLVYFQPLAHPSS